MKNIDQPKSEVNILAKISLSCATFIPIILYLLANVLSSLILILLVPFSLLLAVILGSIACYKISKNKEYLRGKNRAISGIIIGGLLLFTIISIGASRFQNASRITVKSEAVYDIDCFIEALEAYYKDYKHYPSTAEGLEALIDKERAGPSPDYCYAYKISWSRPDMKFTTFGVPLDPWGQEYQYTSNGKSFTILSYGADGKPDGTGFKADISKTITAKEK